MADCESSLYLPHSSTSDILVHEMYYGRVGGYKIELVTDCIEPELVCPLCKGMLAEPLETSCGHAFCGTCIQTYAMRAGDASCPATDCNEELSDISELKPGNILSKLVNKQMLCCPFYIKGEGCSWEGYCTDISSHVDSCYQPEPTWEIVRALASQLNQLAIENTQLVKTVRELGKKVQSSKEAAFYWKIHHVSKAIQSKSELFSPTFLTGKCGYQACLHVYMGGNSTGRATHISLYLQLQQGTNNDILPWPVKCSFVISLLNFAKDEHHFTQSGNTEFDGTGKGVGYPKFISWKEVLRADFNKRFVENDCLLIKCTLSPDSHIAILK